jgi:hypothetical protein
MNTIINKYGPHTPFYIIHRPNKTIAIASCDLDDPTTDTNETTRLGIELMAESKASEIKHITLHNSWLLQIMRETIKEVRTKGSQIHQLIEQVRIFFISHFLFNLEPFFFLKKNNSMVLCRWN